MHYVPAAIREIDTKIADESIPEPASNVWDTLRANPGSHTMDQIIDLFLVATERQKRTQKVENLVKKAVSELLKAEFLYEFLGQYYLMLNKV